MTRNKIIYCSDIFYYSHNLLVQGVNLSGADLSYLDLSSINFRYANLSGANLQGASMGGCQFLLADLSGACLDVRKILLKKVCCITMI